MGWAVQNNWPDIALLRTNDDTVDSSFSTITTLRVELYTAQHDIDVDGYVVSVGFSKLTLQLDCDGTEVTIGPRFGDPLPTNEIVSNETQRSEVATKAGMSAEVTAGANPLSPSIDAKARAFVEADGISNRTLETSRTHTSRHVTAQPNDKWVISSLNGKALDQKYLTDKDDLCRIRPIPNSNRAALDVHLYGHKKDIVFSVENTASSFKNRIANLSVNKEKVFKALLAKSLAGGHEGLLNSIHVQLSKLSNTQDD